MSEKLLFKMKTTCHNPEKPKGIIRIIAKTDSMKRLK